MIKTRIKDLREDNDYTQTQISDFLNISQVAYSYYELGRRSVPLDLLYRTDIMEPYEQKEKIPHKKVVF